MFFNRREALINKEDYNNYIRRSAPKQLDKLIDEMAEDDCIECYTIGLPNSHQCYYDELWLFPLGDNVIPVLKTNINSSSEMAMWSCGIHSDEDIFEDENLSLEDVLELVSQGWRKGLKKVLTENYIKKPKEASVDELFSLVK